MSIPHRALVVAAALLLAPPAPAAEGKRGPSPFFAEVFAGRPCMGTALELTVEHRSEPRARALLEQGFGEAARLESILSNWRPDTELSRFNARAGTGAVPVSPELAEALLLSTRMHELTDGAFDVTLGPVILLLRKRIHDRARLAEAHRLVDGRGLSVRGHHAALVRKGMAVDLGGIGKGFAVDRIRDLLVRGGARSGFIDFGQSSQAAFGPKARIIGVRSLTGKPATRLELKDAALSTSDSGLSPSSILDPRTGDRVPARRQATVTGPSAAVTEGWTKPLIVLGRAWLTGPGRDRLPGKVHYKDEQGDIDVPAR